MNGNNNSSKSVGYSIPAQSIGVSWGGDAGDAADRSPVDSMFDKISKEQVQTRELVILLSQRLSMVRNVNDNKAEGSAPKPVFATELLRSLDNALDNQYAINSSISTLLDEIVL